MLDRNQLHDTKMRGLWMHRNSTQPIPPTSLPNWQIEFSLLERNQIYRVLSDNINWLHDTKRMQKALGDNSSLDISLKYGNATADVAVINGSEDNNTFVDQSRPIAAEHYVLIVLYTFTTLLAIVGNILAIVIFTKGKRSKTDLRPFLINLAVADLIMAIFCIPFTFTYQLLDSNWIFSRPMCPIVMFLQTVSVTGSVSTNMAIGIDRFCAIAFPLNTKRIPFRYRVIIVAIWIIAIAFAGVQLFVGDTSYNPITKHIECNENWPTPKMSLIYTILLLILTYLVPVISLTVTYSIVGYLLWKRNLPGNADVTRDKAQLKAKLKIVKMLVTIVVLFALCWLPLHTFFFVLNSTAAEMDHNSLSLAYFICHWIAMSNSFVNPIVYGSLNDSFRADLKTLLFRCFPCCGGQRTQRHGAMKIKRRAGTYHVNFAKDSESKSYANTTYLLTTWQNTNDDSASTCNISRNGPESSSFTNRSTVKKYLLRD